MRSFIAILFIFLGGLNAFGQDMAEGKVSYITSQHVYAKFSSMKNISEGDTLFIRQGNNQVPALQVKNLSSVSCVCIPLIAKTFKISDIVYAFPAGKTGPETTAVPLSEPVQETDQEPIITGPDQTGALMAGDSAREASEDKTHFKQDISGRISVSSYSIFSNKESDGSQRMRYTFSMQANNLGNSGFSVESYISFQHNSNNWEEVKANIFNGLKIYNLAVKYEFSETMHALIGRKINPKLSSVGAIDGLQFEKQFSAFTVGAFAGSRPDYKDYSINFDLLQYGAYLGHEVKNRNGNMQNTLAFIEQTNQSATDRRFVYVQHTNSLVKNLYFFASAEFDLYKKVNETKENIFDLTNTYLSLRYRIIRPLSVGLSYSARNNLIYYESYKDFVERLLDNETLQGWRFNINYRPAKYIFLGANAGYRYRKVDPQPTKNIHGYVTFSRVPGIGASVTATTTWIETNYLNGMVYGLGMSRELIPGKLRGGIKYRYVDYYYRSSETALLQHFGEANLSWTIYRKLSLSLYYEGTFEKDLPYNRLYINISQRF